jgi:LAO/AO transport system kinase
VARARTAVPSSSGLAERLASGDRAALARMISWAENGDARFAAALETLYAKVGRAHRIGFTGPPGAGKSTLVNEFARLERNAGRTVGILAVDPSSPFSGGALLGDRIRMEERTQDPGVFIRSMASRESHGGIALAAVDACDAMDAFGLERILIETVGVGQAEYDVAGAADTLVVVLCPGAGDGIQAMKAGLLEVADILVVNKSDLPGADRLARDLDEAVHVRFKRPLDWSVPVLTLSAGRGEGVEQLFESVEAHRAHVAGSLAARRRAQHLERVRQVVAETVATELWSAGGLRAAAERALGAGRSPHATAAELVARVLDRSPSEPTDAP